MDANEVLKEIEDKSIVLPHKQVKLDNSIIIKALEERISLIEKEVDKKLIEVFDFIAQRERKIMDIKSKIKLLKELEQQ